MSEETEEKDPKEEFNLLDITNVLYLLSELFDQASDSYPHKARMETDGMLAISKLLGFLGLKAYENCVKYEG